MFMWEYKVIVKKRTTSLSEKELNKLGYEGWNMVAIQDMLDNGYTKSTSYYFKRNK